ncbi:hypothetical protein, partial [Caldifermentibacillus hisashii]|uniref:hypothetical protein n=1 Tax=Caldifermentibacillus hisashii TaxID=996558 RepID=UPI0022B991CD
LKNHGFTVICSTYREGTFIFLFRAYYMPSNKHLKRILFSNYYPLFLSPPSFVPLIDKEFPTFSSSYQIDKV